MVSDMAYIDRTLVQKCLDDLSSENLIGNENDTFISLAEAKDRIEELPTADVVPKSEVEKIFAEIEDLLREWFDHFRQGGDIRESCAIMAALSQVTELKKKYTEGNQNVNEN